MTTKTHLLVDAVIFAGFLAISYPRLTDNTIHEWLGVSFATAVITHRLLHSKWLVTNIGRYVFNPVRTLSLGYEISRPLHMLTARPVTVEERK